MLTSAANVFGTEGENLMLTSVAPEFDTEDWILMLTSEAGGQTAVRDNGPREHEARIRETVCEQTAVRVCASVGPECDTEDKDLMLTSAANEFDTEGEYLMHTSAAN